MMADDPREADGYVIPSRTQEAIASAAREYSDEVLVKARLNADKRGTTTVTPGDISLAVREIADSDDSEFVRIPKKGVRFVALSAVGVTLGAVVGYLVARSDLSTASIASTWATLVLSLVSSVVALRVTSRSSSRTRSEVADNHSLTEEERKSLLVRSWASIEGEMYQNLTERNAGRDLRTIPLRSLIEEYARLNGLGTDFQRSLSRLIAARNQIVHGRKFNLPVDEYQKLMETAKRVEEIVETSGGGDGEERLQK
ncbi:hypothetical protein IHE61_05585 [Streptomyces sp. GKU 257-1]|nr:hypothetical protein [Streptomyces sp. GKU 257-1]